LGDGKRTRVARAKCSQEGCASEHDVHLKVALPPEIILKKFHQAGWHFNSQGYPTCPACLARPKRPHLVAITKESPAVVAHLPKELQPMNIENKAHPAAASQRQPIPIERQQFATLRRVFDKLETHFDPALGRFTKGQSDATIAAELNVPRAVVTQAREEAFGPIKLDPHLAEIETALAQIAQRQERALADIAKIDEDRRALQSRVEAYLREIGYQGK
jgi:hypothetical protein